MGWSSDKSPTIIIDTHADTPQRFADEGWDFTAPLEGGMVNLASARAGRLDAIFFAIWPEPYEWKGRYAHRTLRLIDAVHDQIRRHPESLQMCGSTAEIVEAKQHGRFGVLMGLEGGHAIENDLGLLRMYYRLGIRYMTLTWSNTNEWADSCGDLHDDSVKHHGGLTSFGREVIREMNRLGMMIDVSHVSDQTFAHVLDTSSAPILATHSSARTLCDVPRNLTDAMLRELAAKGGAAMVNFFPAFLDERWKQGWNAQRVERQEAQKRAAQPFRDTGQPVPFHVSDGVDRQFARHLPRAPFESLIDHIDHIAQVAGINHVGIGSDFDGIPSLPEGLESAADLPKVSSALARRGYCAEDLRKIFGGNLLRVFAQVEAAAEAGRATLS